MKQLARERPQNKSPSPHLVMVQTTQREATGASQGEGVVFLPHPAVPQPSYQGLWMVLPPGTPLENPASPGLRGEFERRGRRIGAHLACPESGTIDKDLTY